MGRARAQTHKLDVEADAFAVVFGSGRGSVLAQGQRDLAEAEARTQKALDDFALLVTMRRRSAASMGLLLRQAWQDGESENVRTQLTKELLEEMEERDRDTEPQTRSAPFTALVTAVAVGDPEYAPGVISPAVTAVNTYLRSDVGRDLYREADARFVVEEIVGCEHEVDYYESVQPLIETIASLIKRPPTLAVDMKYGWCRLTKAVIAALSAMPDEVLAGPVSCWIEALAYRHTQQMMTVKERELLQSWLDEYALDANGQPRFKTEPILALEEALTPLLSPR
jgi:hypothetical protein